MRPHKTRRIEQLAHTVYFKPQGVPLSELDEVAVTQDGLEALRLADLEGLYQEAAAERMHVSRATFGRILSTARRLVALALIEGKAIRIEGGVVQLPDTEPKTEGEADERGFGCGHGGARRRRGAGHKGHGQGQGSGGSGRRRGGGGR